MSYLQLPQKERRPIYILKKARKMCSAPLKSSVGVAHILSVN